MAESCQSIKMNVSPVLFLMWKCAFVSLRSHQRQSGPAEYDSLTSVFYHYRKQQSIKLEEFIWLMSRTQIRQHAVNNILILKTIRNMEMPFKEQWKHITMKNLQLWSLLCLWLLMTGNWICTITLFLYILWLHHRRNKVRWGGKFKLKRVVIMRYCACVGACGSCSCVMPCMEPGVCQEYCMRIVMAESVQLIKCPPQNMASHH